ncbi:Relaxin receptor 2-like 2, partial [Homarus americanus]
NIKGSEVFSLDAAVMSQYSTLTTLYLSKNFIQEIHHKNCFGLRTLLRLFLDRNRLYRVDLTCFIHTPALQELNLAHNELTLDNQSFPHLPNLTNLKLEDLELLDISEDHFSFLSKLKIVYFHTFRYCSYVPKVPQCLPNFDGKKPLSCSMIFSASQL